MYTFTAFALVDDILQSHAQALGPDLPAYRNHVIPFPYQSDTLLLRLAVRQHCLRLRA